MIGDRLRTDAYVRALRQAVKPGAVVVDIGTGTGLFAILACRFGARRVYALECGDIIESARQIASANGCSETIEFIQAMSTEVTLPEKADVIVSDLHGVLPLFQTHVVAIADARRRFLAPDGALIPRRDTLWLSCVEAADLHRSLTTPWRDNDYGVDMKAARDMVANQWRRVSLEPQQMMSEPQSVGTIDYSTVDDPDFGAAITARATRAGAAHGLCVWFDTTLAPGVEFSNSPAAPNLIYGSAFFPWPQAVDLEAGDTIRIDLAARLAGGDYVWTWETAISGPCAGSGTHFKQSTFLGNPLSLATLHRRSADHVPRLNDEGRVDRFVLKLMEEEIALGDIAGRLASEFPTRFTRWPDALARVGELSIRYSR